MSSSELATLRVTSTHDAVQVTVLDGSFGIVAEGTGSVEKQLPPGIYELQVRVGPSEERRLFKLDAGVVHEERAQLADPNAVTDQDAVQLAMPSAAPVGGTSTTREEHMHYAYEASKALSNSGASGGAVLMVRVPRESNATFEQGVAERVTLVDSELVELQAPRSHGDSWATAVHPLSPGGYALRVESLENPVAPTFQPVWVAKGWQTLVFVANTDEGLVPDRAAVHMTWMNDAWNPESNRRDLDLAAEAARWSLRLGRPEISPKFLNLLLHTKFRNPMLGIFGAHVLLLGTKPNLEVLDTVVGNLSELVGDHPDVLALRWMVEEASGQRRALGADGGVSWPPMLAASYAAAIRRDAFEPGAIVGGSPAESLAAHLITTGIWTSWRDPDGREEGARGIEPSGPAEPDPATERIRGYVEALAGRSGEPVGAVLGEMDMRQCALGTGLPTGAVRKALTVMREAGL